VKKYLVYSMHEAVEVLETSRTDPKAAAEDKALITSILHRKAWIVEL
jgi:hypothetical protein